MDVKEDGSEVPHEHIWSTSYTTDNAPTCIKEGSESIHCTKCGAITEGSSRTIPKSTHSFSSWTATKAATEIAAGEQTRTCTVCGHSETQTLAQLAPTLPAVKISKPKAAKKSATIKWKKVSKKNLKKIKKIEIQYSMDKSFQTGVNKKYVKAKKTSQKITKLTSKKKYYVRIRAYTSSGGVIHVSKWSKTKTVKAK